MSLSKKSNLIYFHKMNVKKEKTCAVAFSPNALTTTVTLGFPAHLSDGSIIISFSSVMYTFIPEI